MFYICSHLCDDVDDDDDDDDVHRLKIKTMLNCLDTLYSE